MRKKTRPLSDFLAALLRYHILWIYEEDMGAVTTTEQIIVILANDENHTVQGRLNTATHEIAHKVLPQKRGELDDDYEGRIVAATWELLKTPTWSVAALEYLEREAVSEAIRMSRLKAPSVP